MTWIMIVFVWLVAPFAELAVIIGLAVSNDKKKTRIQELEREKVNLIAARGISCYGREHLAEREVQTEEEEKESELLADEEEKYTETQTEEEEKKEKEWYREEGWNKAEEWHSVEERHSAEKWHSEVGGQRTQEEWYDTGIGDDGSKIRRKPSSRSRSGLGIFALILGVIFIVLAGLIFATTTWHILPDICKVFSVLVCSGLFFGISHLLERRFQVHKTGNAFYILGSIFLFLTILAAAYFKLLGAEFILEGSNRWKVLWVGSMVTVGAFWAGMKRFHDRVYTQACLWGVSISLFFMIKACSFGWDEFAAVMMVYASVLVMAKEYLESRNFEPDQENGFLKLVLDGFGCFAPIHFWIFGSIAIFKSLPAVWIMMAEWAVGYDGLFPRQIPLFSFTNPGMAALAALVLGAGVMVWRKKTESYVYLFSLAALEMILYTAGWMTDDFVYQMVLANQTFLVIQILRYGKREPSERISGPFWDICGGGSLLFSIIVMTVLENDQWRFVYLLMAALYCVLYRRVESVKKQALSLSACFAAAAFWLQPYVLWPEVIQLEMSLVPVVWLLWAAGLIWNETPWIGALQNLGFAICLVLLFLDTVLTGLVTDALLLEGICLGAFVWAQVKNRIWWVRLSGGMSLVVALFMTRGFWLSISWWVYLLAAGIGLVVFAGVMEKKE